LAYCLSGRDFRTAHNQPLSSQVLLSIRLSFMELLATLPKWKKPFDEAHGLACGELRLLSPVARCAGTIDFAAILVW
jgi:hypothetical protein